MLVEVLALGAVAVALFYWWATEQFSYWQKRGVRVPKSSIPLMGNLAPPFMLKSSLSRHFQDMYKELEGERFFGYYKLRTPALMIRDPELIKHVLVKDFDSFHDNDLFVDHNQDPLLGYHLLATHGPRWRTNRAKLSPAFSLGKIRVMFPLVIDICMEMKKHIDRALANGDKSVEVKKMAGRFKTDVAALCAFGVRSNTLSDEDNAFKQRGIGLINLGWFRSISLMIIYFAPQLRQLLGLKFVPPKQADFFRTIIRETIEYREKNNIEKKDFLQILMELKNKGSIEYEPEDKDAKRETIKETEKVEWSIDKLTAQSLGFMGDSFETVSTALGFAIFEISWNPEIQEKVKEEVDRVIAKYDKNLCYEALLECTYLDKVFNESLRKYPPIGLMNRVCTKNYTLPGSSVKIEKGTAVSVSIYGLHHDEKYWPNPEVFDPERFNEEQVRNRVPYSYLPFGEGPRMCLGSRFGRLQVKAALATVISFYELKPAGITEYPIKFMPTFGTNAKGGLHVEFIPRKKNL